tara:strand:+ start:411 stop:791 length:381 start_codon:yes stop_codon:yes gene_type:complete
MKLRYVAKNPIMNGLIAGFIGIFLQTVTAVAFILIYLSDFENQFINQALSTVSFMGFLFCLRCIHSLFYGIIGKHLVDNSLYRMLAPKYDQIHKQYPSLNYIKFAYEFPLSSTGFVETVDRYKRFK